MPLRGGAELIEQITQRRVGADIEPAAQPYARTSDELLPPNTLRSWISATRNPLPCRRDGGAHAGHAAARDDEIERPPLFGFGGQAEQVVAQPEDRFERIVGRYVVQREEDGVATRVESRQIVQRDLVDALRKVGRTARLPMPFGIARTEERVAVAAVDAGGGRRRGHASPLSAQWAVQFFVRTKMRYWPLCGISIFVTASSTGVPRPCAKR